MNRDGKYFDFVLPTKVKFGPGKREEASKEIQRLGLQQIGLITTDEIVDLGLHEEMTDTLRRGGRGVEIFTGVTSNPHLSTIEKGYQFFEKSGVDSLVGLGGGSVIDATKAISLCLANEESDIVALNEQPEDLETSLPFFALPTTSGTGSEVDYWAVISSPETNEKLSIGNPQMAPLTAIVDPELTVTLPPELTFFTGIDAFSHALEAFFSSSSNELSDTMALKAMELVLKSLETAVNQGDYLPARGDMALASTLAGAAMQHVGLGLIHAMSHQVSGFYDTNHGLANALLLLNVLEFNQEEVPEKTGKLEERLNGSILEKIEELLDIRDLSDYRVSVKKEDLPELVDRAINNVNAETNPRQAGPDEVRGLYKASFVIEKS
ncbi:iron-containing alcohol dehydrogenase [Candidatus Bipolaricaulota bacterium]|nr:iron-containing alcohol dehydrogenase [Candidatus Bipolaricaulota bacterium]